MSELNNNKRIPWYLIAIFLTVSFCIWTAGYLYYQNQKQHIKKAKEDELSAIADLKVNEIARWRKERINDVTVISRTSIITSHIYQFLQNPANPALKEELISYMKHLGTIYDYKSIIFLDEKKDIRLVISDEKEVLGPDAKKIVEEAIRTKSVVLSDFYRGKVSNTIRLTLAVPLAVSQRKEIIPAGVFLFRINYEDFLYPLIQAWPTPSKTAETLLVRRDGNDVLFLNELRHKKNTALNLRFSISEQQLPAVMAVRGMKGVFEGVDYRGVPVIAALRAIPDSPWFMVAKVDREEIYAPIRERFWLITVLLSVLIIAAGFGIALLWRHQRAQFYRRQYEMQIEKEQAHEALIAEKTFTDSAINSLPGVFYLFDEQGHFLRWNRNFETVTGYSAEEIARINPLDLFAGEEKNLVAARIQEVFTKGETSVEALFVSKNGAGSPYFFTGFRLMSDNKNYLVGMGIDIAARKQAEDELRKYQAHLEDIVEKRTAELVVKNEQLLQEIAERERAEAEVNELNNMLQRRALELEALNKELESFSYSISHDLRAPLRAMDGFSRILLEDYSNSLDDEGKRFLNVIRDNTQNMGQLIDDLLAFSRIGRLEVTRTYIDMKRLVQNVFDDLVQSTPGRRIVMDMKELPAAYGDQAMLRQVVVNLLSNAIKFTAPQETARIEAGGGEEENEAIYYIKDNGVGFDMQYVHKLFGVFQRLHTSKEFEGTGVGLAIVQRVIARHGGRVWAEGNVNEGATFYFTLPKRPATGVQ